VPVGEDSKEGRAPDEGVSGVGVSGLSRQKGGARKRSRERKTCDH